MLPSSARSGGLLLLATLLVSCESPRRQVLRELAGLGVEPTGRSLVEAVAAGNARRVSLLLEARVYTEQRDAAGRTPLAMAVARGDFPLTARLVNAGANVNATQAGRTSVLGLAVRHGEPAIISTLLAGGAQSDGLAPGGEKILPWAIRNGRLDLVNTLIRAGADPHLKDREGSSLLHVAMAAGHRDLVTNLLRLGADPGAVNAAGEGAMQHALAQGWTDLLPELASAGADPNAFLPDGRSLLEQAVDDGDTHRARLLLRIGARPDPPQRPGSGPLLLRKVFAHPDPKLLETFLNHREATTTEMLNGWIWQTIDQNDLRRTRLLLSHGAQGTPHPAHGLSPVEYAAATGKVRFLKLFLDFGLPAGRALHLATARGQRHLVQLMLASGVPAGTTLVPSRDTPLASAVRNGHDRTAGLLLDWGADPSLTPPEGQSLLHLAIATRCPETVNRLLQAGADPNASFQKPVSKAFINRVRPGVMRWALRNDSKVTPLMLASDSGDVPTARYLMRAGAKNNVKTRSSGLWPINFASRRSDIPMMRLFLGQEPLKEERTIEIRLSNQRARMLDAEGNELFSTPVSTGKKGYATPTGEYVITNKYRHWTSTLYHASMPYFQRLSCGDFGLHQGYVPDYPASHGCIRVPSGKASKLFSLTRRGDRVRILP